MAARYSKFFRTVHIAGDVLLLNLAFFVSNAVYYDNLSISFNDHHVKQFLYINLFWGIGASIMKVYDLYRVMRIEIVLTTLLRTFLIHLLFIFAFIVVFNEYIYSYRLFALKYSSFVILTTAWRIGFLYLLKFIRRQGLNFRNVIILGSGTIAQEMYRFIIKHPEHGYRFLGFFDDKNLLSINKDLLTGTLADVNDFTLKNNVDEIYCALPDVNNDVVQKLAEFADDHLIRFKLLPDFRGFVGKRVSMNFYDDIPVLIIRKEPLDNIVNRFVKRIFDIVFSLLVILLIFPWLFPIIALAIKFTSKGPIFFKQLRSGEDNKSFYCYKFRSMYVNQEANKQQATKGDSRITPIGNILRKTSMDELPQFFNVLAGTMSVVGPRPHMLLHTEHYSKIVENFMVRHFVKPGITGLAQVKGCRGETTESSMMEKRIYYDLFYIENWSVLFDIKIILLTVYNMVKGDEKAV